MLFFLLFYSEKTLHYFYTFSDVLEILIGYL